MTITLDTAVTGRRPAPYVELTGRLTGSLHTPEDPRYTELSTPWNLAVPMRPAAVVDAPAPFDVVTGDGELRRATPPEHAADVFPALDASRTYDPDGVLQGGDYARAVGC